MEKRVSRYIQNVCRFEMVVMLLVFVSWLYSFLMFYNVKPFSLFWNTYMLLLAVVLIALFKIRFDMKKSEKALV
ncbi:MAG: hypothetical protein J7K68_06375 [Candidatus Diapherotrites archaeon]|nr:hypothetical protein [Candidatus Diapherotrites archaeon]